MDKKITLLCAAVLTVTGFNYSAHASDSSNVCRYDLTNASNQSGSAKVVIKSNGKLKIKFRDASPNTLYTVWIDHLNRAEGALTPDYPLDKGALERGVAPAFAIKAGVTSGMGLDPNGVITDEDGDAILRVKLDYSLLKPGDSPVVGAQLAMQGLNRVGGGWLRQYPEPVDVTASSQIPTEDDPTVAKVERSTAQGITIVQHPDYITHGHTPGVGGVDIFGGFFGDFPVDCLEDH